MANQEHLDIFMQGAEAWNQWRQEHLSIQVDLTNADLHGAELRYASFIGADLTEADLSGAEFIGTNLISG